MHSPTRSLIFVAGLSVCCVSLCLAARRAPHSQAAADSSQAPDSPSAQLTGIVRDDNGKPLAGVLVWVTNQYGVIPPKPNASGGMAFGRGTTDAAGRYRLEFYAAPGEPIEGLPISADLRGYVRAETSFRSEKPVPKLGVTGVLDIRLTRGEVLAGVVRVPARLSDRLERNAPEKQQHFVRVSGPGFTQVQRTEPGGRFEIWVPQGKYRLELTTNLLDCQASLDDVTSGTRDVELKKMEDPVAPDVLAHAYDALWDDMNLHYSYFELKKIDGEALKRKYRERAVSSGSLPDFVDVLGEMLGQFDDGHIRFSEPEGAVVAHPPRTFKTNINFKATEATVAGSVWIGNGFARVGLIKPEGFGVVRITRQSRANEDAVDQVVAFIRAHADASGFLVDLRSADGGNELLARQIAREFAAKDTVYAKSKYRDGPLPTDFGPTYDRILEASDRPFSKPVVCVLGPGCVSSGEGFAKMMKCLPQVTTVGLPTRGSSGNPMPFKLPGVPVTVIYSRWVDMLPDGTPIEGRGVPPEILVDLPEASYDIADPTWERALEVLREKVKVTRDPEISTW
jgi:Peptidase family S41/Tricorn protease C1 domain